MLSVAGLETPDVLTGDVLFQPGRPGPSKARVFAEKLHAGLFERKALITRHSKLIVNIQRYKRETGLEAPEPTFAGTGVLRGVVEEDGERWLDVEIDALIELAGRIRKGPERGRLSIGDRVSTIPAFSMVQYGVYGESAVVPAHAVAAYPENLSPAEGASIWMQYMTAWGAIVDYGQVKAGDAVLIPAASSSVGLAAIQIVKAAGAIAIATTRGSGKKQALLDAGADQIIVTDEENLPGRVMTLTGGKGANIVFDPVAGPMLTSLAQATAQGGTIFVMEHWRRSPRRTR